MNVKVLRMNIGRCVTPTVEEEKEDTIVIENAFAVMPAAAGNIGFSTMGTPS